MSTSEPFCDAIRNLVNPTELEQIIALQESMLNKFEKTNEILRTVSELSVNRYQILSTEITKHTNDIVYLKKELDSIFKRIKFIKALFIENFPNDIENLNKHFNSKEVENDKHDDESLQCVRTPPSSLSKAMETVCEDSSLE